MNSNSLWNIKLKPYSKPNFYKSTTQLFITLFIFFLSLALARWFLSISYWLVAPMVFISGLTLVRIFIVQHDCGHYSYFKNHHVCDWIGRCLSILTFTPYYFWRRDHDKHHATSGNLNLRGFGDIDTITVAEYLNLSEKRKIYYQIYRHPLTLFLLGPIWQFFIRYRLPFGCSGKTKQKAQKSILLTNLFIILAFSTVGWFVGYKELASIFFPSVFIAAALGVWLFFIQHQFEDAYWSSDHEWSLVDAALKGSSFYRLPNWMHWITGWIGYHHIHHLNSRIPNYNLSKVFKEIPELQNSPSIGLLESFSCIKLALWCETRKKLVSFSQAKQGCI